MMHQSFVSSIGCVGAPLVAGAPVRYSSVSKFDIDGGVCTDPLLTSFWTDDFERLFCNGAGTTDFSASSSATTPRNHAYLCLDVATGHIGREIVRLPVDWSRDLQNDAQNGVVIARNHAFLCFDTGSLTIQPQMVPFQDHVLHQQQADNFHQSVPAGLTEASRLITVQICVLNLSVRLTKRLMILTLQRVYRAQR